MIEWACAACAEAQITLGTEALPPADRLCHACRALRERPSLEALLARAGVPRLFRRQPTRKAWEAHFRRLSFVLAGEWPGSEDDRWLCLWGPTGTGKTSAATVLLAEHLERGGQGLWMDGMTLVDELGREMDSGERMLLPRLVQTPFLVLDEPFAGYLTDYVAGRMLLLIRRRDQEGLPTIVTSQLDPEALVALGLITYASGAPKYPTGSLSAAVSRVLSGLVVELDGQDERLARATGGRP